MSSGSTDRQIQFMQDLGSTILCCTPSYAAYIGETIVERGLQDTIKLKAGIFGAEAWSEEMRRDIEKNLRIKPTTSTASPSSKARASATSAASSAECTSARTSSSLR